MGRSPQGSLSMAKKINNLRVDESIGLFAALVGDQKSQPSGFGCGGLRKAGAGQKRSTVVISDWGRSQITSTQSGHWLVITRKKMNFGAPDDGSSFTQFGFTFFAISHLSRAPVSAMVNVTTR
jgi:hypothetical protein